MTTKNFVYLHSEIETGNGDSRRDDNEDEILERLCRKAINDRYGDVINYFYCEPINHGGIENQYSVTARAVENRLASELTIIRDSGLSPYFLFLKDIIDYCKEQNILTTPGRCGAAGSIVNYLLHITDIDPLRYGLYFESCYNHTYEKSFHYCDVLDEVSQREKRVDFMEIKEGKIYGYCLDDEAKALFDKPEFLDDQILFITKMMLIANRWYQAKIEVDAIPLLIDN